MRCRLPIFAPVNPAQNHPSKTPSPTGFRHCSQRCAGRLGRCQLGRLPDLVVVRCEPRVFALANVPLPNAQILAYLRAVGCARASTIANRLGQSEPVIIRCLDGLIEVHAVAAEANAYRLSPEWREILPRLQPWKSKLPTGKRRWSRQAGIAFLPTSHSSPSPKTRLGELGEKRHFRRLGLEFLGISDDNEVQVIRRPVRRSPRVWSYYYQLAYFAAKDLQGTRHAFCSANGNSPGELP